MGKNLARRSRERERGGKERNSLTEGKDDFLAPALPVLVKSTCTSSIKWSRVIDSSLADFSSPPGSFEQCLDVKSISSTDELPFQGQYCLLDMRAAFEKNIPLNSNPPPGILESDLVWDRSLQMFWSSNHLLSFRYGACIPSSCSSTDFDQLINYCEYIFSLKFTKCHRQCCPPCYWYNVTPCLHMLTQSLVVFTVTCGHAHKRTQTKLTKCSMVDMNTSKKGKTKPSSSSSSILFY